MTMVKHVMNPWLLEEPEIVEDECNERPMTEDGLPDESRNSWADIWAGIAEDEAIERWYEEKEMP